MTKMNTTKRDIRGKSKMLTKTRQIAHKRVFISMLILLLTATVSFSSHAEASSVTYTYDDLNRLTTASRPDGSSFSYNYDDVGNIIQEQRDAGSDICEGDFDGDNDVDGSDLAVFAADYGRTDCP
jgi:YD repeat-containing protein